MDFQTRSECHIQQGIGNLRGVGHEEHNMLAELSGMMRATFHLKSAGWLVLQPRRAISALEYW